MIAADNGCAQLNGNLSHSNNPPNEYLSGIYSSIFPGAGYIYLEQYNKALLSAGLSLPIAANYYVIASDYTKMSLKKNFYFASVNLARFAAYDSYQSALDMKGRSGRILDIPRYKFDNFLTSAFQKKTYIFEDSPSYTIFIPLSFIAAVPAVRILQKGVNDNIKLEDILFTVPLIFVQSLLFSIGEESYFRGYVYPAASELTGSKWAGNLVQSVYFGFSHTDLSERIGFRQFPHVTGTLFHFTSTIDELKEYGRPNTPAGNFGGLKDLQRFVLFTCMGFGMGILTNEYEDGIMKAALLHSLMTFMSILTDYITEGNTGKFFMEIAIKR